MYKHVQHEKWQKVIPCHILVHNLPRHANQAKQSIAHTIEIKMIIDPITTIIKTVFLYGIIPSTAEVALSFEYIDG